MPGTVINLYQDPHHTYTQTYTGLIIEHFKKYLGPFEYGRDPGAKRHHNYSDLHRLSTFYVVSSVIYWYNWYSTRFLRSFFFLFLNALQAPCKAHQKWFCKQRPDRTIRMARCRWITALSVHFLFKVCSVFLSILLADFFITNILSYFTQRFLMVFCRRCGPH